MNESFLPLILSALIAVSNVPQADLMQMEAIPAFAQEISVIPTGADANAKLLARLIWAEARGVETDEEKAAVAWCVLNRVDDERWPDTVEEVIFQKNQFADISQAPVDEELYKIAMNTMTVWYKEKSGQYRPRTSLPNDYFYFHGDGERNYFKKSHNSSSYWNFGK